MANVDNRADDLTTRFATVVKDARERQGMTQQALADRVGASLNHIGKLERAKYLPGLLVAARIIGELGIDANRLLGAVVSERKISRRRQAAEAELIRVIEGLDDKTLLTVTELVTVLARRGE